MIPFKATAYFSANISNLFDRIAHIDSDMDVKVSHKTICNHDFQRNTAKPHCCVIVLNGYNMVPANIATQCCTKNRPCESFRVTSPLGIEDTGLN